MENIKRVGLVAIDEKVGFGIFRIVGRFVREEMWVVPKKLKAWGC